MNKYCDTIEEYKFIDIELARLAGQFRKVYAYMKKQQDVIALYRKALMNHSPTVVCERCLISEDMKTPTRGYGSCEMCCAQFCCDCYVLYNCGHCNMYFCGDCAKRVLQKVERDESIEYNHLCDDCLAKNKDLQKYVVKRMEK